MSAASRTEMFLRDVLARVAAARESYDPAERDAILEDLEVDLVGALYRTATMADLGRAA